ncbi:MAG: isoprenoid biosynthesis glyoxalase ElbB [Planctomycetota bacterium]|nr:isoprenoid biosynthesis glyoxalase ElbB [Planctomycetota bacterium]MDA1113596.1 isoprenoid biosynthesis glyoxalase ElbB [Planctomycetota bacterium]
MQPPQVGVILCGSGRFDGSEIHESVLTLLHLSRAGAKIRCFAPDATQFSVCEHFAGKPVEGESRNMLMEASRIARGEIEPLSEAEADQLSALILPGGNGAAVNLCDFGLNGAAGTVNADLQSLLTQTANAKKPIGAICIAPAIVAMALPNRNLQMTLGRADCEAALEAQKTGNSFLDCPVDQIVCDEAQQVVTTPAYMLGPDIAAVDRGIGLLVEKVLAWCSLR